MGKFSVKIEGPFMDIYRFLREKGFGIPEAKKLAKQQPAILHFKTFEEFSHCVKYFHREPFMVEANCDFETDISGIADAYAVSEEEMEIVKELSNDVHLNNIELINAISYWQTSDEMIPLRCGNNGEHGILFPGLDTENNTVIMACPDCDYIREDIPDIILEYYKKRKKTEKNE